MRRLLVPDTPPAAAAGGILSDQLDPCPLEGLDDLCQSVDDPPDIPFAGFHPLNRRQGDARHFRELALINAKQGASGPHLSCCNHVALSHA